MICVDNLLALFSRKKIQTVFISEPLQKLQLTETKVTIAALQSVFSSRPNIHAWPLSQIHHQKKREKKKKKKNQQSHKVKFNRLIHYVLCCEYECAKREI